MRTSVYFGVLLTFLGLMSCSSQRKLETDPPFTVERPTVEYWVGGREESGTQMRFEARWNPRNPSEITLDSLYFRGRVMKAEPKETETGFLITGTYIENMPKTDIIMHADPRQEVGNQPPKPLNKSKAFPFDLLPDEAVISYLAGNAEKKQYYKIKGVVEKQGRISPGRTKN
ncbi:MAG: hypothetical protein WBM56_07825 [Robiginitalea sp.]|uniref:hypothetical protein n=1 Tax=Robiginitalea sp. TaxID=1902411 RepID=UPI003C74C1C2